MSFHHHTLDNGLQVVAEVRENAYSQAMAFLVNTGARDETPDLAGVSHFLEHMAFKATAKRTAAEVNRDLDLIGSRANAFTSEEHTVYHASILPEYQNQLLELLADMLRPALREEDFATEKQVILEEIAKYEDEPPYRAPEWGMVDYFGDHPLANSILGSAESVAALTAEQMRGYFERRYSPTNVVLAASGNVDFPLLVDECDRWCGGWSGPPAERVRPAARPRGHFRTILIPESQQQYIYQLASGPAARDADRYAATLLAVILGDSGGSRLFWELVEPGRMEFCVMGAEQFDGAGVTLTYGACMPDQAQANLQRIFEIQRHVQLDGVAEEELERAKVKLAAQIVRQSERPGNRLFAVGGGWLERQEYEPVKEVVAALRAVTRDDIAAVTAKHPLTPATIVTAGPAENLTAPG